MHNNDNKKREKVYIIIVCSENAASERIWIFLHVINIYLLLLLSLFFSPECNLLLVYVHMCDAIWKGAHLPHFRNQSRTK